MDVRGRRGDLGTRWRRTAVRGDQWTEERGSKRAKRVVGAKNKDSWRGLVGQRYKGWL